MISMVSKTGVALLLLAAAAALATASAFTRMRRPDLIVPGPGISRVAALSAYLPALIGTPGDTAVYVLEGHQSGGTVLVLGGTHGDEPAGYLAAVILLERARVGRGRLIVVPRANESGFTHNVPQEGHPQQFIVETPGGPRRFTFGARATNPVHQWPDPQVYTLASGQALSGSETRNLNRAYPGRADGTLTERVAFAMTTLIRTERVDLALDLHEASPEYPVVNTIVAHQRATDLAALANLGMQAAGVDIGLEASPETLRGLSHREWGDTTPALAVLMETTNPAEGRLRGPTNAGLVVEGRDRFYVLAAERRHLSVPFDNRGWPLARRVGRHLAGVSAFVAALSETSPANGVELSDVPTYDSLVTQGIGAFLASPKARR
jgi:predicted deacylase